MRKVIPVIHNTSSVQRLVDMARIVLSMNIDLLVATKVYGAAAQSGIAEAFRLLLKAGKGLVVLPELKDAVETYDGTQVFLVDKEHAAELVDPLSGDFTAGSNSPLMLVFNGSDAPFSPQELSLGKPIYIKGLSYRAGSTAEASLLLYGILR
ncbi:RecB-family nuclease-like protein [Acidilobus saccharovorans 345-15]|uniref:RecB-family nuclease-like protein n=1 Tax=Acidilobus saccharovorans (strain DSM 16705 / JCM 18335 / VKM B-2471 / 345-15) TaxID=666510 RepID=D9Q053_ACIS3|nr:RecB-family nuclease [Acidilobus saccharovorans]ADL18691.1 RecB-family nuclease-like protein [Acidilobus saccharovorans 345-15]